MMFFQPQPQSLSTLNQAIKRHWGKIWDMGIDFVPDLAILDTAMTEWVYEKMCYG